jgi:hypothetical protein
MKSKKIVIPVKTGIQILITIFYIVLPGMVQAELFLMDQIKCVVCGPDHNTPFVDTDVTWKRTLENKFVDLQKQIQADIVLQQIATEKMPLDPDGAPKYIEGLKKQHKINDAELETLFSEVGRTMAEGLEMLNTFYATEFFTHYKFKSQLVPTDDEINEYYNENPEFIDGSYEITIARVPYDDTQREKVKDEIAAALVGKNDGDGLIVWGNAIKIAEEDLSSDQKFITEMQPEGVRIQEAEGMFELVKLISSQTTRIKTLKERQNEIIDILNRKKLEGMVQTYNDSVREFVDVISLDKPASEVIEPEITKD